ncbi:transposase [Pseudoalteromonas sp. PB2-1]|uniref:transposase n=1 Tax=Pseudoalteromonas sp. PB2-1 TaxID=2907242 RepID=UPI00386D8352
MAVEAADKKTQPFDKHTYNNKTNYEVAQTLVHNFFVTLSIYLLVHLFTAIIKKLWRNHFWQRGYFVDTVGVNVEIIRRYVRHQEKIEQQEQAQLALE